MGLSTRVWGAGKTVLLAGALVLTYILFAAAAVRLAIKARDVVVPPLSGKTVNEATGIVGGAGLNLKVEEARRVDAAVPAGRIISQDPPAGFKTRRERSVKVWVSAGARALLVPALLGAAERTAGLRAHVESERTAVLAAQQDGLQLAPVAEIRSADYPVGTVIAQNPPPKSSGARLAPLVYRGERGGTHGLPDLIGVNGDRAAALLRSRGFRVSLVGDH